MKARRGALILGLPVGYLQTRDRRVEKHPDQRVQHAIALVFAKFAELGSVRQMLLWFRQEQVTLPALGRHPTWGDRVTWRLPVYNTVLMVSNTRLSNLAHHGDRRRGRGRLGGVR